MKESAYKCSLRRMQTVNLDTANVSTCIPSISWRATFVPFGPFLHPCPDLYQTDVHRCSPSNLTELELFTSKNGQKYQSVYVQSWWRQTKDLQLDLQPEVVLQSSEGWK
ncbi:hypothetical protein AMECASPLE_039311 [Ameca splendens]|uniref:Uncharacterized protein n=1 Tax=Ameca splendens TaxID=208324 RepID=A0ABV1A4M7_9TELE